MLYGMDASYEARHLPAFGLRHQLKLRDGRQDLSAYLYAEAFFRARLPPIPMDRLDAFPLHSEAA